MRIIEKLEPGNLYHLYNRGINSQDIFNEKRNYYFFLEKYKLYCSEILETYAYALLKNHFHLIVKVKEQVMVPRKDGKGETALNPSRQLSHFFNSYAQSYNKAYNRHGKLLEEPFRRKLIDNESYFTSLIYYVHFNPQYHGFVDDFRKWEFTSWHFLVNNQQTFLAKEQIFNWFGSKENFENAHLSNIDLNKIPPLLFE
jgi:REP element-mobilizing transposase RayT